MAFINSITKGALIAAVAAGALIATATTASADVACNRWGECWHVHNHYNTYPAELGVTFHGDNWWGHHRHYHWRADHDDDHGYYRNGVWIHF